MNRTRNAILFCVLLATAAVAIRAETARPDDPAVAALRAKLEKPATLRVSEVAVHRALGVLAKSIDVPIQILEKREGDAFDMSVTINVQNARAIDIFDALRDTARLAWEIRSTGLVFSANGVLPGGPPVLRMYNVDDLTATIPNSDAALPEFMPDLHDGQTAMFAAAPTPTPTLTNIADMIRNRVQPESWDPALGTSIEERGGVLVVMQHEAIHAKVRQLLSEFRTQDRRQIGVDMRALSMKSTDIDKIRRDIIQRGGAWPFLDAPALATIEKLLLDGSATGIFEGSTLVFNGQRGRLQNIETRNLLVDYEISGDAYDPRIQHLTAGWTALIHPVLSDDASRVALNLKISQTEFIGAPELFTIQRGGLIQAPGTPSTITIRQKKTAHAQAAMPGPAPEQVPAADVAKEEVKADANTPVPAPQGNPVAAALEDVTHEFDIQNTTPSGPPIQSAGPLQLQLQPMSVTRVKQDLQLPAGKSIAVCAPLGGKDGLEPGREMLTIVRCEPLNAITPRVAAVKDAEPDLQTLTQKLQKPITLALGEIPLPHAIQTLSIHTGIPVMIDHAALDARLQESVAMNLDAARGEDILNAILTAGQCSVVRYPSLLLFTVGEKAGARGQMLRIFDIRDLTMTHSDYPVETGHETAATPSTGVTVCTFTTDNTTASMCAADFQSLIKDRLFPAEFADPAVSIEESSGKLIVMQTPAVLAKIEKALTQFRDIRRRVNITARWAVVNTADLRGTLGAEIPHTLDAAQAEKIVDLIAQPASRAIATARLSAYHGQRVSAFGGVSRPSVVDYDVTGSALDPVVGSFLGGVKCDVLPLVIDGTTAEQEQITLSALLSLSKTDLNPTTVDPLTQNARIMPSLPPQPGKIHSPKVQKQETFNTMRITDGGAALFRLPPPAWLQGEDATALQRGQRTMIVVLQAQIEKN
jgi:hypothetical protein